MSHSGWAQIKIWKLVVGAAEPFVIQILIFEIVITGIH